MNRLSLITSAVIVLFCAAVARPEDIGHDVNYRGRVNFDAGAVWSIKGVVVTSTAAMLNGTASSTFDSPVIRGGTITTSTLSAVTITAQALTSTGLTKFVSGDLKLTNTIATNGAISLMAPTTSKSTLVVDSTVTIGGGLTASSTVSVVGTVGLSSNLNVGASTNKFEIAGTTGNAKGKGTLVIDGAGTFGGAVTASSTVYVVGISGLESNLNVGAGTNKLEVDGTTGNVKGKGTFVMDGASTLGGAVTASSTVYVVGIVGVESNLSIGAGTNKVEIAGTSGNIKGKGTLIIDGAGTVGGAFIASNSATAGSFSSTGRSDIVTMGSTGQSTLNNVDMTGLVQTVSGDLKLTNSAATNGTVTLMGPVVHSGTTFSTTNDINIDAKFAMVGPDAANGLELQYGTVTNGQVAVAFGHVFGAGLEPVILLQPTDVPPAALLGTNYTAVATVVNTTNFTLALSACPVTLNVLTNFNYVAIGRRP